MPNSKKVEITLQCGSLDGEKGSELIINSREPDFSRINLSPSEWNRFNLSKGQPGVKHQTNDGLSSLPCQNILFLEGVRRPLLPGHDLPTGTGGAFQHCYTKRNLPQIHPGLPQKLWCKDSPQISVA